MKSLRQCLNLFRRRKLDAEMAAEMRQHLELQAEHNRVTGMDEAEAGDAALRQFGNVASLQEQAREGRGWIGLEHFWRDLRFAARSLWNNPGFTLVVVAVLAVGIGANSAVFSIIDALLLRPLPVTEPSRLMVAAATGTWDAHLRFPYGLFDRSGINFPMPYPFFEQFRDQCLTADVAAVSGWTVMRPLAVHGSGNDRVDSVNVEEVSGNYFSVVGIAAALGRTLSPEDDNPGQGSPVAVISDDFWRTRFNSDPAVLGKVVQLDNVSLTIIGVIVPRFSGARVGNTVALWVPINLSTQIDANAPWGTAGLSSATTPWINLLVRPHAGISQSQATADLDLIYQRKLAQMDPERAHPALDATAHWLTQHILLLPAGTGYAGLRSDYQKPTALLMTMVGFMQLVACANVTGLLVARGAKRRKEFALRAALGAGRMRLLGQMLTESLLLAGIAGAIGLLLAEGGTRLLATAVAGVPLWADWRLIAFTSIVTLVTGLAFGLIPSWHLSREQFSAGMKESSVSKRQWVNSTLVVAQIGMALLLLVVAGLLIRTLHNLVHADRGFQPQQRLLFDLNVPSTYKAEERFGFYQRMTEAIQALPGVESASVYQGFPLLGDTAFMLGFTAEGYTPPSGDELRASLGRVGLHFFDTMGIPIVLGRDFGPDDGAATAHGPAPLIISEWSARKLFGDANPLGRHIKMRTDFEVVGVARNVKYGSVREESGFLFYLPLQLWPNEYRVTFAVKAQTSVMIKTDELNRVVGTIDPRMQISSVRTIAERLDQNISRDRLIARLAGFFGVLALAFAGIGLFGLMSYSVSQRTKEFGVRLALGATPEKVLRDVIRHGILVGLIGSGMGVAGAIGLTHFIGSQLYGVPGIDPVTFSAAVFGLMLIVLLASSLPARRASKVDPMIALRAE